MTAKMLLEQYMAERHALGFVSKTDEGCIRRFLRDYKEPEDGKIVFSKEYVLEHIGTGLKAIIRMLKAEGKTIFLTSHHFKDIEQLCDQVYSIEDCRLIPITEEIAARYREME